MMYAKAALIMLVAGLLAAWVMRTPLRPWLDARPYKWLWATLLAATVVLFLAGNIVVLMAVLTLAALVVPGALGLGVAGTVGLFLALSTTQPSLALPTPLLEMPIARVLSLVMLLPLALRLAAASAPAGLGPINWRWVDISVVGYELLGVLLEGRVVSGTHMLRLAVMSLLDVWLPYYVVSRGITSWSQLRTLLAVFCVAMGLVVAATYVEQATRWAMYSDLQHAYGQRWLVTWMLERGGWVRVRAMTPQPIMLGYLLLFAIAYWVALVGARAWRWRDWRHAGGTLALLLALYCTVSRGPMMGGVLFFISLLALHRIRPGPYGWLVALAATGFTVMVVMGWDDALVRTLKEWIGDQPGEDGSIDYRKALLDTSLVLIRNNPWFGASDYFLYMEHLRQGEGIIDMVNTYIHIALAQGLVGVALFLIPPVVMIRRLLARLAWAQGDDAVVARALISLTVAALFVLFTTSTYWIMPQLYATLVALGLAYARLPAEQADDAPAPTPPAPPEAVWAHYPR